MERQMIVLEPHDTWGYWVIYERRKGGAVLRKKYSYENR